MVPERVEEIKMELWKVLDLDLWIVKVPPMAFQTVESTMRETNSV